MFEIPWHDLTALLTDDPIPTKFRFKIEQALASQTWNQADEACQQGLHSASESLALLTYRAWIAQHQGQILWATHQWQHILLLALKRQQPLLAIYSALALHSLQPEFTQPLHILFDTLGQQASLPSVPTAIRQPLWEVFSCVLEHPPTPFLAQLAFKLACQESQWPITLLAREAMRHLVCQTLLPDLRFEQWGTHWRRECPADVPLEWLATLACQGWLNEYLWPVTEAEQARVEQWQQAAPHWELSQTRQWLQLALYQPLWSQPCAPALLADWASSDWPELRCLADYGIKTHQRHQMITSLPHFGKQVPQPLGEFYEHWPYPRWLPAWPRESQHPLDYLHQLFPASREIPWPRGPWRWLVAGCGTGQDVVQTALGFRDVQLTALDLSYDSLAQAIQLLEPYAPGKIEWWQGDLLELGLLQQHFQVIQACGVLHHLPDPVAGLKVLVDQLQPGGLLKIMVYRQAGRQFLQHIQRWCQEQGLSPATLPLPSLRQRIITQAPIEWVAPLLASPDFFCTSGCHDLLWHIQETDLTLADLESWLKQTGLSLLGFEWPEPGLYDRYRQHFPQEPGLNHWPHWAQLEHLYPHLFGASYRFWCWKPVDASIP